MAITSAVHTCELDGPRDPLAWLRAWDEAEHRWLLESALVRAGVGRWSFAGGDPWLVLRVRGRRLELDCRRAAHPDHAPGRSRRDGDPLAAVRALLPPRPAAPASSSPGDEPGVRALPFLGGAVGVFGYGLTEQTEALRLHARDDLGLPDLVLLCVDHLVAFDAASGRCWAVGLGFAADAAEAAHRAREACRRAAERRARAVAACAVAAEGPRLAARAPGRAPVAPPPPPGLVAHFDEASYAKAVATIGDEIAAGNVYQANLSQRMDAPFAGDPASLYEALRRENPAPFAACVALPDPDSGSGTTVLSSSPERFLRLRPDGRVESRPIKGTRPRGASATEDEALRRVLACSEKDRAENLMIVDLVRNDLGRVCRTGSVRVPELMRVEPYATVFQLVSAVSGRLRRGADAIDLLRATFPPGSMTGAPKRAALRLIDRLEPVRRGIYSGALGYLDVRGGADLSVVIRTLVLHDGRAYLSAGGGVVADSDPVAEYRESLDKARALWAALARATGTR